MTQQIKILIACHKRCSVPAESCYLPAYDSVMQRRSGHRFNMCVMRRDCFDAWRA